MSFCHIFLSSYINLHVKLISSQLITSSLLNVALNLFNTPCLEDYLIWYLYNHAFLLILILYMIHTGFILSLNLKHIFLQISFSWVLLFSSVLTISCHWIMKFNLWTFFICFQMALLHTEYLLLLSDQFQDFREIYTVA